MKRGVRLLCAALLAAAWGCAEREAPRHLAPAQARAALVLEPPQVAVGDVADVVLSVVTRPGTQVAPPETPPAIPGFWWVERGDQELVKEPERWLHNTRLRIRAVEVGSFEFPGGRVKAASAENAQQEIEYAPLAIEVVSSLGDESAQRVPFGIRRLPAARVGAFGAALAFGAGAVTALGVVGVVALARRRPSPRDADAVPDPGPPPWEVARARLAEAEQRLASDPRAALDAVAHALRGFAAARYGADTEARTHEELLAIAPPFLMTTRWTRFVALLRELDGARFPAQASDQRTAEALLADARKFVAEGAPPGTPS
jgi:hypothetical protein